MKVGDLIYDKHHSQSGIVIDIAGESGYSVYATILYEDGSIDNSVRKKDFEGGDIGVINESR